MILLLISLPGCLKDTSKDLRYTCADHVNFDIQRSVNYDFEICYDNRGAIEFVILNPGKLDILGFRMELEGSEYSSNTSHDIYVPAGGAQLFMANVQLSKYGKINRIAVVPKIMYEGEPIECGGNRVLYYTIKECDDLPLY